MFPKKSPKVAIGYAKCGERDRIDLRNCTKCLKVCDPAILILHESMDMPVNPVYPKF